MYKFIIETGDPSGDGHSQGDRVLVKSNKTMSSVMSAYKESAEMTGLVFQENETVSIGGKKLDWKHPEYKQRRVCVDYQDSSPSELAYKILIEHGIEEFEVYGSESLVSLFMEFVKLSLPDLEYEIIQDKSDVLPISIGYGIYD